MKQMKKTEEDMLNILRKRMSVTMKAVRESSEDMCARFFVFHSLDHHPCSIPDWSIDSGNAVAVDP